MDLLRLETSRLFQRFSFGPKPGEYSAALRNGVSATRKKILQRPETGSNTNLVSKLILPDLGKRPTVNSVVEFNSAMKMQSDQLLLWWLDQMVLNENTLQERMTWFWHGHWATSISKVNYALPMYLQNQTLRANSLGNFTDMTKAMLQDGALQFWLDGQDSTKKAPNENLGRELLELFTLGVNRYTEEDVKSAARALTGYQVTLSNGKVVFKSARHDYGASTILGEQRNFTGASLCDLLVARDDCSTFIAERLWYRFMSSTEDLPAEFKTKIKTAFAARNIFSAVESIIIDGPMRDEKYEIVKSPVEWFVAVCRALELTPSKLSSTTKLKKYLTNLGQIPFLPPSVGGWPAGEVWLTAATAQYRIEFAQWLISQSSLKTISMMNPVTRTDLSADWLGVAQWSERTKIALKANAANPEAFVLNALCSPEYVVSA